MSTDLHNDELVYHCESYTSPIADICLSANLAKKVIKLMKKKAIPAKRVVRGSMEICKAIKKGMRGVVVIAADTYPVDVVAHIPAVCEGASVPYAYIRTRKELGLPWGPGKGATAVFILEDLKSLENGGYDNDYIKILSGVRSLNPHVA